MLTRSRPLMQTGRRKPLPGDVPDWGHPLCPPWAGGVLTAANAALDNPRHVPRFYRGQPGPVDLPKLFAGTEVVAGKWGGPALRWPNGQTYGLIVTSDFSWLPATDVTIMLGYRKTDTTNRISAAFGSDSTTTTDRIGCHLPYSDGRVYFDFGGFTPGSSSINVAWTSDTIPHIWTFTGGPRGMEIWRDGILLTSNSAHPVRTSGVFKQWYIGGGNTVNTDAAELEFGYLWPSQLPQSAIRQLSSDPFQFWRVSSPGMRNSGFAAVPPGSPGSVGADGLTGTIVRYNVITGEFE